ncbi:MAG: hypothetical protein K2W82_04330 [Candidatus Obscuribacterales bacterium]|nr:hypothetical protein [Candidatus Obscuribacterales bacterium]
MLKHKLLPFVVFAAGVVIGLAYNLGFRSQNVTFVFDSAHYLHSANSLVQYLSALSRSTTTAAQINELASYILVDGPILPGLGACVIFLLGESWQSFVFLQCLFHGLSALLVFLLCQRLCKSDYWALAAGIAFASYFSAIIAAGRFLTETVTTTVLLGLAYLLVCGKEESKRTAFFLPASVACGFVSGVLLLTKAALMPIAFLSWLVVAGASGSFNRALRLLSNGLVGLLLPLILWLSASYLMFDHASLFPERSASLNIAAGLDIESAGWSAMPLPSFFTLNYSEKPAFIFYGAYANHQGELAALLWRKVARLFCFPWNDFRQEIFGLDIQLQIFLQRLLLGLSLSGAYLYLVRASLKEADQADVAYLSILFIAGHLIFVPFEAMPRYAYPAVPFMFVLGAAFLLFLQQKGIKSFVLYTVGLLTLLVIWQLPLAPYLILAQGMRLILLFLFMVILCYLVGGVEKQTRFVAYILAVMISLTIGTGVILSTVYGPERSEWQAKIEGQTVLARKFGLAEKDLNQVVWTAILIDGDKNVGDLEFILNGKVLADKPASIWTFPNSYRYQQTLLHTLRTEAQAENVSLDDFRQWRLLPISSSFLLPGKENEIMVKNPGQRTVTLYGDYNEGNRLRLPSLSAVSIPRRQNDFNGHDGRLDEPIRYSIKESRSLKDGQLQSGNLRLFILVAHGTKADSTKKIEFGKTVLTIH